MGQPTSMSDTDDAPYSAQNVDRMVTLYRAAKRAGRIFVTDLYAPTVARATSRTGTPQADGDGVRVFVPSSQRIAVKRADGVRCSDLRLTRRRDTPPPLLKRADG
jgi:ribonuclease J